MTSARFQRLKTRSPHRMAPSMKTLALVAVSLSLCIPLAGCIAPFRVKARAYATADMASPAKPDSPQASAPPK